jgi:hypothetical protein
VGDIRGALLTLIRRCLEEEAGVVLLWRWRRFGRWLGSSAKQKAAKVVQVCVSSTHVKVDACGEGAAGEMVCVEASGFKVLACRQTEKNGVRGGKPRRVS